MQILHQVDAVGHHERVEAFERRYDMRHDMAAVIKGDVRRPELLDHGAQEFAVSLVTDPDVDLILLERCALGPGIEAHDRRERTKILFPELK